MNIITAQNIIIKEELTLKAQAVFTYLADRSNHDNICWPGLKRIAAECKISVSTVQRAIRELLLNGLLIKKPNFRENGSQTSNIYILTENIQEKSEIKKQNERTQSEMQERMKRQMKKEKLVAAFKTFTEEYRGEEKAIVETEKAANPKNEQSIEDFILLNKNKLKKKDTPLHKLYSIYNKIFPFKPILTTPPSQNDHPITYTD